MKTYFDTKFAGFVENFSYDKALKKTVDILLYQSSTPLILKNNNNKFYDFWDSDFIAAITAKQLSYENIILALSQYIRSKLIDEDILIKLLHINQGSVAKAIRLSGIIANPEHPSWQVIKIVETKAQLSVFSNFIQTVDYIQKQYQARLEDYQERKKRLNLDQITAMIFSSLYAYEYLIIDTQYLEIPYQIDTSDRVNIENVWHAFHEIITSSNIDRNKLSEKKLALTLKHKLMPFLIGENLTPQTLSQYENFKTLVAHKVEMNLYENKVINSYCYRLTTSYYLENNQLKLETESPDLDFFQEKFAVFAVYWQWRGANVLTENPYFERLDRGKNLEANAKALAKTQGIVLQLHEVYGIDKAVFEQEYDLYALLFTMLLSQAHYTHDFIEAFKKIKNDNNQHSFEALSKLMMNGMLTGQNRMPVTFAKQKDKAIKMSDWIIEGGKNKRVREMNRILDFWSQDLQVGSNTSYIEKSFYKIDDYTFALPWMSAQKNFSTATVNTFRKLYKNRAELKHETDAMEKNLAELFKSYDCKVICQHEPLQQDVGEIDLIVMSKDAALVIELKSTYIKSSIKEIYEYKNFVLNKAAYQLDKKTRYVKDTLLANLGLKASAISVHSWIVDTTLEFDHEYIDGFLKVSFEELVIVLNGHRDFLSEMLSGDSKASSLTLSSSKKNLNSLISNIENSNFWNTNLPLINSIKNIDNASKLRA